MKEKQISKKRRKDVISLLATLAVIVMINIICSFFFRRFDLTTEKRYTLNDKTIQFVKDLNDVVLVKVYLEGDFNPAFTRLKNETREILDEFRAYAKKDFNYEFINIYDKKFDVTRVNIERELFQKGMIPVDLTTKTEKGDANQKVFPGAIVSYKGRETVWQIFRQQVGVSPEVCVNNSVQSLEYELSNSLRKLKKGVRPAVAFLQGHGELDTLRTQDIAQALSEYYDVGFVKLNHRYKALRGYQAIIIASPDSAFDEKDKFIIDQFIMKGGKSLWCVDGIYYNRDSLSLKGYSLGLSNNLNLGDLLFNYGVRINPNLVLNIPSGQIPINKGYKGGQPDFQMFNWYYTPLILPIDNHPIVKNLDLIKFDFASSLDTISSRGIKKKVLLTSSKYSRVQGTPARINLAMINQPPDEKQFNDGYKPMAVLLEGKFQSPYDNHLPDTILSNKDIDFRAKGVNTGMIVISDGDVIKNDYQFSSRMAYPLGYDKYMKITFANKMFILNCMNYLLDGADLLSIRARDVKLRLLDKKKIKQQESKWQMVNVGIPLVSIFGIGIVLNFLRRKRYTN